MTNNSNFSFTRLLLQVALGLTLGVSGIYALQGGGDEAARAIKSIFSSDVSSVLVIIFGVMELLAGVFLLLSIFIKNISGTLGTVLMLIITIVWLVAIILCDFLAHNLLAPDFLHWALRLGTHTTMLGALLLLQRQA